MTKGAPWGANNITKSKNSFEWNHMRLCFQWISSVSCFCDQGGMQWCPRCEQLVKKNYLHTFLFHRLSRAAGWMAAIYKSYRGLTIHVKQIKVERGYYEKWASLQAKRGILSFFSQKILPFMSTLWWHFSAKSRTLLLGVLGVYHILNIRFLQCVHNHLCTLNSHLGPATCSTASLSQKWQDYPFRWSWEIRQKVSHRTWTYCWTYE